MREIVKIILLSLPFLFNSCEKNTFYLESKTNKEARFVVIYYTDSIYLGYLKYTDKPGDSGTLFKKGDEYWEPEVKEREESGLINIGAPFPESVSLSKKEYRFQMVNEEALINDSILIYSENGQYITEVASNIKPVKRIFYYDSDFHIDSIIWVIGNNTHVYK